MLDSNGPLPFSQEGMWQDSVPYDLCGFLTSLIPDVSSDVCRILPDNIRYVMIPSGNAAGPGLETECRKVPDTKYCHNLFQIERKDEEAARADQDKHHQQEGFNLNPFTVQDSSSFFDHLMKYTPQQDAIERNNFLRNDTITANSPVLEMFLDKNANAKRLQSSMERILTELEIRVDIPKLPLGLYVFFWWQTNALNGPGYPSGGHQPPFPYQGACYPAACSNQDIKDNNVEFAKQYFQVYIESHRLIWSITSIQCTIADEYPLIGLKLLSSNLIGW